MLLDSNETHGCLLIQDPLAGGGVSILDAFLVGGPHANEMSYRNASVTKSGLPLFSSWSHTPQELMTVPTYDVPDTVATRAPVKTAAAILSGVQPA